MLNHHYNAKQRPKFHSNLMGRYGFILTASHEKNSFAIGRKTLSRQSHLYTINSHITMTVLGSIKCKDFKPQWLAQRRLSCNQKNTNFAILGQNPNQRRDKLKKEENKIQRKSPEYFNDDTPLQYPRSATEIEVAARLTFHHLLSWRRLWRRRWWRKCWWPYRREQWRRRLLQSYANKSDCSQVDFKEKSGQMSMNHSNEGGLSNIHELIRPV